MALADYAAPIADADNPLLPWVRVRDGVIETQWPGHALRAAAGARALAVSQRAVRLPGAAGGRAAARRACARRRAPHRPARRRAGRRRRVERQGDAARPAAARRSKTSTCFRTWATAAWRSARPSSRRRRGRASFALDLESPRSRPGLRSVGHRSEPSGGRPAAPSASATCRARVAELLADGRIVMWFQGAHGVRPAGAWAPQRAGAARSARPARSAQSGAEAARVVSAVLPQHARERGALACSRTGRAGATAP